MTDPVAERDAGAMAAADALMDLIHPDESDPDGWPASIPCDWRDFPSDVAHRDAIYAALLSERQRGREEMRERAAALAEEQIGENIDICGIPCPEHAGDVATAIRSLSNSAPEHDTDAWRDNYLLRG